MVGQQHQIGIERRHSIGVRLLAVEHVEEVGRLPQTQTRLNRFLAVANPLPGGHQAGHDRRQQQRLLARAVMGDVIGVAVDEAHRADRRAQDGHGLRVAREGAHDVEHRFGHEPLGLQRRLEQVQLVGIGQLVVPKQVDDLFVGRIQAEIADIIAAIDQNSFGAIDIAR